MPSGRFCFRVQVDTTVYIEDAASCVNPQIDAVISLAYNASQSPNVPCMLATATNFTFFWSATRLHFSGDILQDWDVYQTCEHILIKEQCWSLRWSAYLQMQAYIVHCPVLQMLADDISL